MENPKKLLVLKLTTAQKEGNEPGIDKETKVTVAHRYDPELDEQQRRWNELEDLIMIDWPEEYTRVYMIEDYGPHPESVSEFLHYTAFLESCVNRLAVIYMHKAGCLSWAVIDDAMYEEVCREFGFDEESFERER